MIKSLQDKFTEEFSNWSTSLLKNILCLTLGILEKENCNLMKVASSVEKIWGGPNSTSSHYRRLNRLFQSHSDSDAWLDLLVQASRFQTHSCQYLTLDGSSWEKGKTKHHYLTLASIHDGVAQPIYFQDLEKKGTSNQEERIAFFKECLKHYNLEGKTLLADREYIGTDWFSFLFEHHINFIIRCRQGNYKSQVNAESGMSYEEMERKVLRSKKPNKCIHKIIEIEGQYYQFIITKNHKNKDEEPLLYLMSNLTTKAQKIVPKYRIRWQIECCFKHLKSNGFQLENMNVKGLKRKRLLMSIIIFAYSLSIKEGIKTYKNVSFKKYKDGTRYKSRSLFRHGRDKLRSKVRNITDLCKLILEFGNNRYRSPNAINV